MPPIHRKSDNCLGFLGGAERRCDPAGLQSAAPSWPGFATARKGRPFPPGTAISPLTSAQEPRGGICDVQGARTFARFGFRTEPRFKRALPVRLKHSRIGPFAATWPDQMSRAKPAPRESAAGALRFPDGATWRQRFRVAVPIAGRVKDRGMKDRQARVRSPDTGLTTRLPRRPHWGLWFGAGAAR